ncbi:MAG: sensor histidine kinase [Bacteriovoracia bacterium]
MNITSISRRAYFEILKISLIYSLGIVVVIISIAYLNFREAHIATIDNEITSVFNSYYSSTSSKNYPSLVKTIQQKTRLQEVFLFSKDCTLLASTSLMQIKDCHKEASKFETKEVVFRSLPIYVFYKLNVSLTTFIKKNFFNFTLLYLLILLVTSLILYSFFKISFLNPLKKIKWSIENDEMFLPSEFSFFGSKIIELKNTIETIEKERMFFNIARRVVHDIRNPLLYLKIISNERTISSKEVLEKVEEIDFHINSLLSTSKSSQNEVRLGIFLENLKSELEKLFQLNIRIAANNDFSSNVKIKMHPLNLKNIFLNLARNSFEAKAENIQINHIISATDITFTFSDDGVGLDKDMENKIFKKDYTTKKNGHGIGLKSISRFLTSIGGSISVSSAIKGASFRIIIPLSTHLSGNDVVLIDNDKFIHIAWKAISERKGKQLHSFYSVEEFLSKCNLSKDTPVFIDSDLGEKLPGEVSSKMIFERGFRNIFLATSYTDINLEEYPWINSLVSKSNPFLN